MAATVHHPLSANPQSFHHLYSNTSNTSSNTASPTLAAATGLTMPGDASIAPIVTTLSPFDYADPPAPDSATSDQTNSSQNPALAVKKRRASKGKVPAEIKRSASTPHMRSLATSEGDSLSPTTDKKRNKLGYHRTSVACGHCRRRKIRCLPAPDDHQGRCSNCIRLKKECNFYPVDQEAQHGQQKSAVTGGPKAPSASNPSSPRTVATSSHESVEDFNNYNSISSSASNSRFILSSDHEGSTTSSVGSGMLFQPAAALPPHINPYAESIEEPWNPGFFTPTLGSNDTSYDSQNPAYWRSQDPESASAYGTDSKQAALGYSQPRMNSVSSLAYTSADESQNWPTPVRSMSYGAIDTLPQQYSHQQPLQHHPDYSERPPVQYSHPQSLEASGTITSATVSAPLSAPIVGPGMATYGYTQQTWNPTAMYRAPATGGDAALQAQAYSQPFYADPGSLQQIKEEHASGTHPYPGPATYYQPPDSQILR